MSQIISKELLSVVLNCNVTEVGELHGSILGFSVDSADVGRINIYELAHKYCKEWADRTIISGRNDLLNDYNNKPFARAETLFHNKTFHADTEPEAVFKACQWILENSADED